MLTLSTDDLRVLEELGKLWELGENLDHKKASDVGCDKIGRRTFNRFSAFGRPLIEGGIHTVQFPWR